MAALFALLDAYFISNWLFPCGCFIWPLMSGLVNVQWNLLGNVTSFLDRCLRRKSIVDKRWYA